MFEYDKTKLLDPDLYYRVRHSGYGAVKIVEYCGPSDDGKGLYRVQYRPEPDGGYAMASAEQLVPLLPGESHEPIPYVLPSEEQRAARDALQASLRAMTDADFDPRKVIEAIGDGVNGPFGVTSVEAFRLLAVASRVLLAERAGRNGEPCPTCEVASTSP
jgi:hypothetical protein